jgi:hypothetical protein
MRRVALNTAPILTPQPAERIIARPSAWVEAARSRLEALGYDERFRRLWRMYLAYCEGGFAERRIGLVQMLLAKPRCRLGRGPGGGGLARETLSPEPVAP